MMMDKRRVKLFVGLGNAGIKYENTRHNMGFIVLDELAKSKQLEFRTWRNMLVSFHEEKGNKIYLLKPLTFMNCSGDAVYSFMSYYKIVAEKIFVFCDDFLIPLGEYKIRMSGSSGGHNGINSIIARIGKNFPRMKLGIGDPRMRFSKSFRIFGTIPNFMKSKDYVLSEFKNNDKKKIDIMKKTVISFFDDVCVFGLDKAVSKIANKK
ncbi:MAG: aminoacyl-tRNA hydrolase [Endomicrobium sp.]|jgi:PTH1 family peptidyl-tRNA hydrolase|nr:aminoacyl-tRNA hydrolase [Endomicrobium sp.]